MDFVAVHLPDTGQLDREFFYMVSLAMPLQYPAKLKLCISDREKPKHFLHLVQLHLSKVDASLAGDWTNGSHLLVLAMVK